MSLRAAKIYANWPHESFSIRYRRLTTLSNVQTKSHDCLIKSSRCLWFLGRIGSRIDCDKLLEKLLDEITRKRVKRSARTFVPFKCRFWVAQVVYSRSVIQHVSDCVHETANDEPVYSNCFRRISVHDESSSELWLFFSLDSSFNLFFFE